MRKIESDEDTRERDRMRDPAHDDHFSTDDDDTAGRSWHFVAVQEVDDQPDLDELRDRTSRTPQDRDANGRFSAEEEP